MRKSYSTDLSDVEWEFIRNDFENNNPRGRPEKHPRREIVNAALYVLRTGTQWRLLPKDFPPWQTVYSHLRVWRENKTLEIVFKKLREAYRILCGRNRQPTAAIVDSQSVKTTERGIRGFDPAKKNQRPKTSYTCGQSGTDFIADSYGSQYPRPGRLKSIAGLISQELSSGEKSMGRYGLSFKISHGRSYEKRL